MSKSIMQQDDDICYLCGGYGASEWHHIFNGAFKKRSEKYGAMVRLCHWCHNEYPNGVHHNQKRWNILKEEAQRKIMAEQGWTVEQWRSEFEKNYL